MTGETNHERSRLRFRISYLDNDGTVYITIDPNDYFKAKIELGWPKCYWFTRNIAIAHVRS